MHEHWDPDGKTKLEVEKPHDMRLKRGDELADTMRLTGLLAINRGEREEDDADADQREDACHHIVRH